MKTSNNPQLNHYYERHCKHLRLKGLQPKTIDAYTRALRRIGDQFDFQIDNLDQDQLLDYFQVVGSGRPLLIQLYLLHFNIVVDCSHVQCAT